mgnify:CR=1 FL=1
MEIWDIYTEDRQLTGRTMIRDDWNMGPDEFHISVTAVIQDPDGRYLITQRSEDKPWGAGWWEFPGGGVNAGETPEAAAAREAGEETGLDLSDCSPELIFSYKRVNPEERNNYYMDLYRFVKDFTEEDVTVQDSEVQGFRLATLEEIRELGDQGVFMHYSSIRSIFE